VSEYLPFEYQGRLFVVFLNFFDFQLLFCSVDDGSQQLVQLQNLGKPLQYSRAMKSQVFLNQKTLNFYLLLGDVIWEVPCRSLLDCFLARTD